MHGGMEKSTSENARGKRESVELKHELTVLFGERLVVVCMSRGGLLNFAPASQQYIAPHLLALCIMLVRMRDPSTGGNEQRGVAKAVCSCRGRCP